MSNSRYRCMRCLVDWLGGDRCWNCGRKGEVGAVPGIPYKVNMMITNPLITEQEADELTLNDVLSWQEVLG